MKRMRVDLKRENIADKWEYEKNESNKIQKYEEKENKQNVKSEIAKKQMIRDLWKQHEKVNKAKLDICITLDQQKKDIRDLIVKLKKDLKK